MYKGNVFDTDIDSAHRYMDLRDVHTQSNVHVLNNLNIYLLRLLKTSIDI